MRKGNQPYALSAKRLARMFDLSTRTIQRWDQRGLLTRYQGPRTGDSGKGAPVRYPVADFLEFLRAQPGSRTGSFQGRFASMGDVLR